eukprot:204434_1
MEIDGNALNRPTCSTNTTLRKWLMFFFVLTMTSSAIRCVLNIILHVPKICSFLNGAQGLFASAQKVFLTFYQIGRLQYCFPSQDSNQAQSTKYKGYGKCTLYTLYANGIIFGLSASTLMFIVTKTSPIHHPFASNTYFGCTYDKFDAMWPLLLSILGLWYYVWDWSVIVLYIRKILQLKHAQDQNNEDKLKASDIVNSVLKKILLLTFIYEASTLFSIIQIFHDQIGDFALILRP